NDDLKTAYDFIEHFPESEVKSYKGSNFIKESSVSVETFTIGDDGRSVIFSRGAAEVRYKLKVPPSAVLDFGIGLKPVSWKEKKYYAFGDFAVKLSPLRYLYSETMGVQFDIFLTTNGKEERIFSEFLDPANDPSERKWFDFKIDLSASAGKEAEIVFKTSSAPKSNGYYDRAGWSSPRLTIKGEKVETTELMRKFPLVWNREGVRIYENKGVLPRAYFVHQSKVFKEENDLKKALQDYSFNPRDMVYLLNEGEELSGPLPFDEKDVKITDYSINEVTIEVNARSRGYLVLSDTYFPGWHAYVDGKETAILKADYVFRALLIDKGAHCVKFVYKPESFEKGKIISLLSLGFMGVLFLSVYIVRTRKGKTI
ncbi:MAG: YfhO family protein, partial [Candidatus Omnitrophica bacterium]|nr:YfhO family protein [Candidatus Omnitrophota bacterium]